MLEVLFLFFLSQKIKKLAVERNLKSFPWTLRMIGVWFGIEIIVMVVGIKLVGLDQIEDPSVLLFIAVPAMILAYVATHFLVINRLKNIVINNDSDDFKEIEDISKPNLDHFR